jgi:xylulose-5-phosphate/fructose-6-phosphate phosphoketolase
LMLGYGWEPYFVAGDDPVVMHSLMASTLDRVIARIIGIQRDAREQGNLSRPRWPMIVLQTPKGWTGPKVVDGKQVEGTSRSHQVPLSILAGNSTHLQQLVSCPGDVFSDDATLGISVRPTKRASAL